MKKLLSIVFLFAFLSSFSQETETVIRFDAQRNAKSKKEFIWKQQGQTRGGTASLTLPFFDDFSRYSLPTNDPAVPNAWQRWSDTCAFINSGFPIAPPSIGVATLDGLRADGYPYDFADEFSYGSADTLTSLPIDLSTLTAADQVFLSFFYQGGGMGNNPDTGDSLIVEFFSPFGAGQWTQVWTSPEVFPTDTFEQIFIAVDAPEYLLDGFQFRFRNFGTLSGAFDHWHIDYVQLDAGVDSSNVIFDEVCMQYPLRTLLNEYTAMPLTHFAANSSGNMASSIAVQERNLGNDENIVTSYSITKQDGTSQVFNAVDFNTALNANSSFTRTINLNGFTYNVTPDDTCSYFDVKTFINPTDARLQNDTATLRQYFYNYYAYDDGTAERGYSNSAAGGMIATKFRAEVTDSLLGLFVHWLPSGTDVSAETILLRAWSDGGTTPGDELGENYNYHHPAFYQHGENYFSYYAYDNPIAVTGNFYVGWVQSGSVGLPIGNDKSGTTNATKVFYNNGFQQPWQQSSISGSLMIRPVFKSGKSSVWNSITELSKETPSLFPNPFNSNFTIQGLNENHSYNVSILSSTGKLIESSFQSHVNSIEMENNTLPVGMYFIQITNNSTQEIIRLKAMKQ
ncbi:MAG: hypothetical protein RL664_766 [Bacteroidota bacterium]|jgi:hypothetical protein